MLQNHKNRNTSTILTLSFFKDLFKRFKRKKENKNNDRRKRKIFCLKKKKLFSIHNPVNSGSISITLFSSKILPAFIFLYFFVCKESQRQTKENQVEEGRKKRFLEG